MEICIRKNKRTALIIRTRLFGRTFTKDPAYEIDTENIEEFLTLFFSCLNQFTLFITFEWYDNDSRWNERPVR